jgi:hypothetical protein
MILVIITAGPGRGRRRARTTVIERGGMTVTRDSGTRTRFGAQTQSGLSLSRRPRPRQLAAAMAESRARRRRRATEPGLELPPAACRYVSPWRAGCSAILSGRRQSTSNVSDSAAIYFHAGTEEKSRGPEEDRVTRI